MKKNYTINITIYLLLFITLLSSIIYCLNDYQTELTNNKSIALKEYKKTCEIQEPTSTKERCNDLLSYSTKKENYWEVIINTLLFLPTKGFVLILILILPITLTICRYLRNNNFINEMQRISLKKIKRKLLFKSYLPTIILTLTIIIMMIISYTQFGGFIYNENDPYNLNLSINVFKNPILYSILFLFINICNSITYANITLLNIRKNKNFIQTTIMAFLSIILIELALEIVIGGLICNILLKNDYGIIFNIINGMSTNFSTNVTLQIIFHISITLITLYLVSKKYKDKEQLIIDYN